MSGAERRPPLISERDRGDETESGALATSLALARQTRNGARTGTTARSLAESALQDSTPIEMTARPSSMPSLITTRRSAKPLPWNANLRLSSVAHARRMARGRSTLPRWMSLATMTQTEAVATQMGQLTPAAAEKRTAAPRAEV